MTSTLLHLYTFLCSPNNNTLPLCLTNITNNSINEALASLPDIRELTKAHRAHTTPERFKTLKTPQAYKMFENFLKQLITQLENTDIFESLLIIITQDRITSENIIKAFDDILLQWKNKDPKQSQLFIRQDFVQQWYLEQLSDDNEKIQELIEIHYQNIKHTLHINSSPNGLMAILIETILQNPFKLFAYLKFMIEEQQRSPKSIVDTELFHWFFLQHVDKIDANNSVFQCFFSLLSNAAQQQAPSAQHYATLLELLESTNVHCVKTFPRTLTGKQIPHDYLQYTELKKPTTLDTNTLSLDTHKKYYFYFGLPYLVKALTLKKTRTIKETEFLENELNNLPEKDITTCLNISISDATIHQLASKLQGGTFYKLLKKKYWKVLCFSQSQNVKSFQALHPNEQESILRELSQVKVCYMSIIGLQTLYLSLPKHSTSSKEIIFEIMVKNFITLYFSHYPTSLISFFRAHQAIYNDIIEKITLSMHLQPFEDIALQVQELGWQPKQIDAIKNLWSDNLHSLNELKNVFPHIAKLEIFENKITLDAWIISTEYHKRGLKFNLLEILQKCYATEIKSSYNDQHYLHIISVLSRLKYSSNIPDIDLSILDELFKSIENTPSQDEKILTIINQEKIRAGLFLPTAPNNSHLYIEYILNYASKREKPELLDVILKDDSAHRLTIENLVQALSISARYGSNKTFTTLLEYACIHNHDALSYHNILNDLIRFQRTKYIKALLNKLSEEAKTETLCHCIDIAIFHQVCSIIMLILLTPTAVTLPQQNIDKALNYLKDSQPYEYSVIRQYLAIKKEDSGQKKQSLIFLLTSSISEANEIIGLKIYEEIKKQHDVNTSDILKLLIQCSQNNLNRIIKKIFSDYNQTDWMQSILDESLIKLAGKANKQAIVNLLSHTTNIKPSSTSLCIAICSVVNCLDTRLVFKLLTYVEENHCAADITDEIIERLMKVNMHTVILHILKSHTAYSIKSDTLSSIAIWAARKGYTEILKTMQVLNKEQIQPFDINNYKQKIFELICSNGHVDTMQQLIAKKNFFSPIAINSGLYKAAQHQKIQFITAFFSLDLHPNDRSFALDGCLLGAVENNTLNSLKTVLTLTHPYEISTQHLKNLLSLSIKHKKTEILEMLLRIKLKEKNQKGIFISALNTAISLCNAQATESILFSSINYSYKKKYLIQAKNQLSTGKSVSLYSAEDINQCLQLITHKLIITEIEDFRSCLIQKLNDCISHIGIFQQNKADLKNKIDAADWLLSVISQNATYSEFDYDLHQPYLNETGSSLKKSFENIKSHEKLSQLFRCEDKPPIQNL